MKITVDERLYKEAQKELAKKGKDVDAELDRSIKKAGTRVAAEARRRAPKDSGEGAQSIRASKVTNKRSKYYKATKVGPTDDEHQYMLFPEFGTESQNKQWFVHGALDDKADEIVNQIESDLRKVLL